MLEPLKQTWWIMVNMSRVHWELTIPPLKQWPESNMAYQNWYKTQANHNKARAVCHILFPFYTLYCFYPWVCMLFLYSTLSYLFDGCYSSISQKLSFTTSSLQRIGACWFCGSWLNYGEAVWVVTHTDGLVQNCSKSSALAMELPQSYSKPSIWYHCRSIVDLEHYLERKMLDQISTQNIARHTAQTFVSWPTQCLMFHTSYLIDGDDKEKKTRILTILTWVGLLKTQPHI